MIKQKFSSFSIVTIFICLAVIGAWLIPLLSVQLTTSRTSPVLRVNYSWQNASAKIIEQEVTSKLEGLFSAIRDIQDISSESEKGKGIIDMRFKKNSDIDAVRFEVANIIRQSYPKLPVGVSYPKLSSSSSESNSPILSYRINSNKSPYYMKKYADSHILPRLSDINGVSQIRIYGASPYEWVITYNSDKLLQLELSVNEITEAIKNYLQKKELGKGKVVIKENNNEQELAISLIFKPIENLNWTQIPIKKLGTRILYLGDIASIHFKESPPKGYYRINGLNTLNMVVYPIKGVNTIELSKTLKNRVAQLGNEISNDYQIKLTRDTSAYLVEELQKIQTRTLFSLVILLVLTILVYRNIKYLSILFLSIIINLLVAVVLYYVFKVELQLFSFAGITISFGIIIDNSIVMMDHIRNKGNKKAFLAILAATLTTIGAILVIFLLEENQQINLLDFALVIAINIGVSLLVSLYLVPALLEKFKLTQKTHSFSRKNKRRIIRATNGYIHTLLFLRKPIQKTALIFLLILGFGLPISLMPKTIEGQEFWKELYNSTIGNEWFSNTVRPTLEKVGGGTLRLFMENVFENSYYVEPKRTVLRVSGSMPEGATVEQLNEVIRKIEQYISSFDEVELFETSITDYNSSNIYIYFKDEYEFSAFPYSLKSLLETRSISLGGLDWTVSGVGRGFSNALTTGYKSKRIVIEGYNYDRLYAFGEILKEEIKANSDGRVKDVEINSGDWGNNALHEYYLNFDSEQMALNKVSKNQLYEKLKNELYSAQIQSVINNNELQPVKLVSDGYQKLNLWDLKNIPIRIAGDQYKLKELVSIEKKKMGNTIQKFNQEYRLVVAYDFIGPAPLAKKFMENRIAELSGILPVGYKVSEQSYNGQWNKKDKKQYYYIFIIVVIIFFICSVLLESLKQPFAILSMIPISFVGVFLTFYWFDLNFDQGGYASFILLSGISVNSALYIINDFNNLKRQFPKKNKFLLYFKAFNYKIIPILLTIVSTIAGLIPFVWEGQNEVFWFAFAAGSIGGLIFSLLGIFIYLPLFIGKLKK